MRFPEPRGSFYRSTALGIMAPPEIALAQFDEKTLLAVNGEKVMLGPTLLRQLRQGYCTASLDKVRWYIAGYYQACFPFELISIDRIGSRVLWKADVLSSHEGMDYDGVGFYHYVTIVVNESEVFVFGVGLDCAYVEGFTAESGKWTLSFHSHD